MSFLFKSKQKPSNPNALPPASRDIRSSDGPPTTNGSSSQIPTLNGIVNGNGAAKPASPTPGTSVNNSLNSVAEQRNESALGHGQRPSASSSVRPSEEKQVQPFEGTRSPGPPSPEQKSMRGGIQEAARSTPPTQWNSGIVHNNTDGDLQPRQRMPPNQPNRSGSNDPSPYPWSTRQLTFTVSPQHPFPRYGAAVNATASRDGSVYLMGGLINGSTVKGDLWMVEAVPSSMTCYPVATTSEGPGPRVGHASLLVGNAFIVFGGDTKMDDGDQLDDTLYLLNTSTKQWSRALPAGPRPPGRYGHTLNILGSKIYVFGGQVEGYFFNDLVAFDLNALQQATNRWEVLIQNTIDGGPPHGQIPPARTNHTMITYGDKLYLFGGTDGVHWYNDVWSYSPHTNSWTQNECIGYIPSPREGHAAALVNDVMYIFGGRTEEGNDLGDLAAFRISTRRWYTFQNMGPSPSPRSGHSMTTVGKQIVVLAGEPSSAPRDPVELAYAYFLDTSKIRYPPDSAQTAQVPGQQVPQQPLSGPGSIQQRRPSGDKNGQTRLPIGGAPGQARELGMDSPRSGSANDFRERSASVRSGGDNASRLPQFSKGPGPGPQGQLPAPSGPPPQAPMQQQSQQQQQRPNGVQSRQPSRAERGVSPTAESQGAQGIDRAIMSSPAPVGPPAPRETSLPASPSFAPEPSYFTPVPAEQPRTYSKPETYQPSQDPEPIGPQRRASSRAQKTVVTDPPTRAPAGADPAADILAERDLQRSTSRTQKASAPEPSTRAPPGVDPAADILAERTHERSLSSIGTPKQSNDSSFEGTPRPSDEVSRQSNDLPEPMSRVQELQEEDEGPQDSGIGSSPALTQQFDDLSKELEQVKQRNAWYASELAMARKAGYQTRSTDSPVMDERAVDIFRDEDKPLIEALLRMKTELARVQGTIDGQSKSAAEKIAEVVKQRDAAISEAVYAKTRLAGHASPAPDSDGKRSLDQDRGSDMSRRLASSLHAQNELSRRVDGLVRDVENEKQARQLAEDTAEAAQKRVTDLDAYRQQHSSEMEGLRGDLHEAQREARDVSANHSELKSQHDLLAVDKREVDGKLESARVETENHTSILASLREAVSASEDKAQMLEQRLEEEHGRREGLEAKLRQLKSAHEDATSELENTSQRLRDAEAISAKHAEEARTHRGAVLAGLGKVNERGIDGDQVADERVGILQGQVESANAMVRQNQAAADTAAEKLRRAEERIAGLEAFQEQASREGLSIRKQMQTMMKENQGLSAQKMELEQKVQSQMLETNALSVQHASLRDILGERGINAAEVRRSRAMDSPSSLSRFSTPDLHRVKELEQQLENSLRSHDEMKTQFEEVSERDEKMKREYEDKLTALDNDHQAAVKYLRGTEKMLSKMKQELQRVKDENREMKKKIEKAKDESQRGTPEDWEAERERLKKEVADVQAHLKDSVEDLETRIETMQGRLQSAEDELHQVRTAHATSQADLSTLQATHSQSRGDLEKLQKDNSSLEERARDAENKVQLLLDQVESSVDNYRRQSRLGEGIPTMNGTFHHRPMSGLSETDTSNRDMAPSHSRNQSDGAASMISDATGADGRNSIALDSLATELDALRSHWETTKNYRLSDRFDFERTPTSAHPGTASGDYGSSLASWRRGLDVEDDEDGDEDVDHESRRPLSEGDETVRDDERGGSAMASTTPTHRDTTI